jgi:hypothetical protein
MTKYTVRHDKTETGDGFLGDGKVPLGITIGSLKVILAFVAYEFFWGTQDFSDYLLVAPLIVSLLVALASTYFAANALLEQRKMREAGTDPVLIAHLDVREDARELITFKVSNVGAGAALNVQLEVELPDDNADDWEKRQIVQHIFKRREPFAVILQGNSIEFNLALGWRLLGQDAEKDTIEEGVPVSPLPPFKASLSYEDLAGGKYEGQFTIDVREMQGRGVHKSPQMRMVAALEKIAKRK